MRSLRDRTLFARFLVLLLALGLVAAACGGDDDDDDGAAGGDETTTTEEEGGDDGGGEGGTLIDLQNFATGEPDHIDPGLAGVIQGAQISQLLYDGLTEYDFTNRDNPELKGLVAEDWEVNDDATEFVFKIRDDVTFSNGDPVLPSSFAFAWNRAANPEFASEISYHFASIQGYDEYQEGAADSLSGLVADDEAMTLTVTLSEPFADFAGEVSHTVFSPMPEEEMADLPDQTAYEQGVMIGNGPFVMAGPWEHEQRIVLERNDSYFGGLTGEQAKLDRVEFVISKDIDSAYNDFEAGNGQTASIPSGRFAEATDNYPNATEPNLGIYHFFVNQENPVLGGEDNLLLRQAISLAIDREAINDTVYDGSRRLPTGMTPPGVGGYEEGLCEFCEYDPERAQELMDEWGGEVTTPIKLNFNTGSGHEDVVAIIQANLDAIGVPTELDGRDPTTYFSEMRQGACELCRAGWIWDFPAYHNAVSALLHSESIDGDNIARYNNPEVDAAIDEAKATIDDEERWALYAQAEKQALDDVALIPINWYAGAIVYHDDVKNFVQTPGQFVLYEQVTLDS